MSILRPKDWLKSPEEWADWGDRFDLWMHELVHAVRCRPVVSQANNVDGTLLDDDTVQIVKAQSIVQDTANPTTYTFAEQFPNGIITVVTDNGDTSAQPGMYSAVTSMSATGFTFGLYNFTAGPYRLNFIAVGY